MALSLLDPATREACLAAVSAEVESPEWVAELAGLAQNSTPLAGAISATAKTAIDVDCAIRSVSATAEIPGTGSSDDSKGIFRAGERILDAAILLDMRPLCMPGVKLLNFEVELTPYIAARQPADLPASPEPGDGYLAVIPVGPDINAVLQMDSKMAQFLQQCDGRKSARNIAAGLEISAGPDLDVLTERLMSLLIEGVLILRSD